MWDKHKHRIDGSHVLTNGGWDRILFTVVCMCQIQCNFFSNVCLSGADSVVTNVDIQRLFYLLIIKVLTCLIFSDGRVLVGGGELQPSARLTSSQRQTWRRRTHDNHGNYFLSIFFFSDSLFTVICILRRHQFLCRTVLMLS